MKNKLRYIIIFCVSVFTIGVIIFLSKNANSTNNLAKLGNNYLSSSKDKFNFNEVNLKRENITVNFEGSKLNLTLPMYVERNRYYLPLTEIINSINGKITFKDGIAFIEINNDKIDIHAKENYFYLNSEKVNLKKKVIVSGDIIYASLFDIKKMLNLKIDWDEEKNTIGLFWNRDRLPDAKQPENGKTALIRFEDVSADQRYSTPQSLEKLRTIFDYCYSKNIPMHLSWVPRFIDPENNIDNDPAKKYSIHNANFIYTLDYFTDKNGTIGLHGYTHQHGNGVSIDGTEFDGRHYTNEKSVQERLEYAINDANNLEIPIAFFESPHYAATTYQKNIFEKYFDIIYEYRVSFKERRVSKVKVGDRIVKYIPTPLGYLNGKRDVNNMVNNIRFLKENTLGSFFFHPNIEFEFITILKNIDGYPAYNYSDKSPLNKIINTFIDEGYTFKSVNSI